MTLNVEEEFAKDKSFKNSLNQLLPQRMIEVVVALSGIDVKEIVASTMESKLVKGLYFVGEVLDVDAMTGGFNLQIAWSTGYTAGSSIY